MWEYDNRELNKQRPRFLVTVKVTVTPDPSLNHLRRRIQQFHIALLSFENPSDVRFVVYGRVNTTHRQQIMTSYLDSEWVPPWAATRALALILDLHRNTKNFPEVSEVRIQTHWERVVVEEEDRVWPLEKHVVGPGTTTRETSCAICLDEFSMGSEAMRMPCSHVFHGDCIVKWLKKRLMCPLCRFKLPSSEETTSTPVKDIDLD